jgi:hypothetical protein
VMGLETGATGARLYAATRSVRLDSGGHHAQDEDSQGDGQEIQEDGFG